MHEALQAWTHRQCSYPVDAARNGDCSNSFPISNQCFNWGAWKPKLTAACQGPCDPSQRAPACQKNVLQQYKWGSVNTSAWFQERRVPFEFSNSHFKVHSIAIYCSVRDTCTVLTFRFHWWNILCEAYFLWSIFL